LRRAAAGRRPPQAAALLHLIQELVRAESPSDDKAAVNVCVALAAAHAKALGGRVKLHHQKSFGNLLEARFGPKSKAGAAGRVLLLLGHLDTVWPLGTLKAMPLPPRRRPPLGAGHTGHESWRGHGFTAIEMLAEAGLLNSEIVLLLNTDEEIGSPASRPITERLAAECAAVFVLEPAQGLAYKTARKGVGEWRIDVTRRGRSMLAWTLKRARTPSASCPASSKLSPAGPI